MTMGETAIDSGREAGYTLESVLACLIDQGWVNDAQAKEVRVKERQLRAKVIREKEKIWGKTKKDQHVLVSPAEMIAAFGLSTDNGELDEDRIMECVAMSAGLPYYKIDPLKLDSALITQTLSRPFARKNIILPLWKKGNRIAVAIDNPHNMEIVDNLKTLTNCEIDPRISSKSDILASIREVYGFRSSVDSAESELEPTIDVGNFE